MRQFRTIKATLDRILVNQEDKITEIYEKKPVEFQVIKDLPINLKLKLSMMLSPMNLFISYLGAPKAGKRVHFYLSDHDKEPTVVNA